MTSNTAHPGHHLSTTKLALALAGGVIAVGAGYGVAALVLDDPSTVPAQTPDVGGGGVDTGQWGSDPEKFRGTNREERALMHRN